jgi:hypothetical protein
MKKIAFAAASAMILIACADDTNTPGQGETSAVDSTSTAVVDPDVPAGHYQPIDLNKLSIIRESSDHKIDKMTAEELSEIFGIPILGDENDLYSGTYGIGRAKEGEQPHGKFAFNTKTPESKEGTWNFFRYNGEMSYGKPAGEWKVLYMNYENSKPAQNLTITIPFKDESCGEILVKGQIHQTIALSEQVVNTEGACSAAAALEIAMKEAQRRVDAVADKQEKLKAKKDAK